MAEPATQYLVLLVCGRAFAVPTRRIREIVPSLLLTPVPQTPAWLAGECNYRGRILPVVDLGTLFCGRPSRELLTTRILITEPEHGILLGLKTESVESVLTIPETHWEEECLVRSELACLDGLTLSDDRILQRMEIDALLPPELAERFRHREEADA